MTVFKPWIRSGIFRFYRRSVCDVWVTLCVLFAIFGAFVLFVHIVMSNVSQDIKPKLPLFHPLDFRGNWTKMMLWLKSSVVVDTSNFVTNVSLKEGGKWAPVYWNGREDLVSDLVHAACPWPSCFQGCRWDTRPRSQRSSPSSAGGTSGRTGSAQTATPVGCYTCCTWSFGKSLHWKSKNIHFNFW